jgi:hypothetical protein
MGSVPSRARSGGAGEVEDLTTPRAVQPIGLGGIRAGRSADGSAASESTVHRARPRDQRGRTSEIADSDIRPRKKAPLDAVADPGRHLRESQLAVHPERAAVAVADIEVRAARADAHTERGLDQRTGDPFDGQRQITVTEVEVVVDRLRHVSQARVDDGALEMNRAESGAHVRTNGAAAEHVPAASHRRHATVAAGERPRVTGEPG